MPCQRWSPQFKHQGYDKVLPFQGYGPLKEAMADGYGAMVNNEEQMKSATSSYTNLTLNHSGLNLRHQGAST
jgi:hypothetical protein